MTFDELLEEVYILTNRRDLVAETKSAIKAATLKAHKLDFFPRDIKETGVSFLESNYLQCFEYTELVTRFRAFKYLRRVQDEYDENGVFFEFITPEEVLDAYGCNRSDICYLAGNVLQIRSSEVFDKALLGYYVVPDVTEANYDSWVAEVAPFAIIYEAARIIFKAISYDEQAATFSNLIADEYAQLRISSLPLTGY